MRLGRGKHADSPCVLDDQKEKINLFPSKTIAQADMGLIDTRTAEWDHNEKLYHHKNQQRGAFIVLFSNCVLDSRFLKPNRSKMDGN